MNYKEHCAALECEIVGYRCVLEAIKLGSAAQRNVPLYRICEKTLLEPGGAAIATEVSLIRVLETIVRRHGECAHHYTEVEAEYQLMKLDMASPALLKESEETLGQLVALAQKMEAELIECLRALDKHRAGEQARQKLAYGPKLVIPGVSL